MSRYFFTPSEWQEKIQEIFDILEREDILVVAFPPEAEEDMRQVLYLILSRYLRQGKRVSYQGLTENLFPEAEADLFVAHHLPRHPEVLEALESGKYKQAVFTGLAQELNRLYLPFKILYWNTQRCTASGAATSLSEPLVQTIYALGAHGVFLPLSLAVRLFDQDEDLLAVQAEELQENGLLKIIETNRPPAILLAPGAYSFLPGPEALPFSFTDLLEKIDLTSPSERYFLGRLLTALALRPALKKVLSPETTWASLRQVLREWAERLSHYLASSWEFLLWGRALRELGLADQAVALLRLGQKRFPQEVPLLYSLGEALAALAGRQEGSPEEVREVFGRLNLDFPENPYFLLRWARFEAEMGRQQAARELLEEALSVAPENPAVFAVYLDFALETCRYALAERLLAQALSLFPENLYLLHLKARFLLDTGESSQAQALLKDLRQRYPLNLYLLSTMVEVFLVEERFEEALVQVDQGLELCPEHPVLKHQKARVLLALGKPHEAVAVLEALLDYDPYNARTGLTLCQAYELAGEGEKALTLAAEFLKRTSFHPPFLHRQAEVLLSLGKESEAEAVLKEILDQDPLNPFALCTLARIYLSKNRELAVYWTGLLEEALKGRALPYAQRKRLTRCLETLKTSASA